MALILTTLALLSGSAADAEPVAPQPGMACSSELAGAMSWLPAQKIYVVCLQRPTDGYQWQIVTSDYPSSDRWLTYGPPLTLRGEGTRNHNLRSGDWTAMPQDPSTECVAEQTVVIGAGVVSPPHAEVGTPGQQLPFSVLTNLFSITLTGYCLWSRANL